MKRLITSLLLLCTSAYADAFGPNDKVLYFNSETLIEVIKNTFPQNLQLDVANKYVELMDSKGNVSIDDLRTVCGVGQLDNAKCKNFIRDLINTMGDDTIKPFYWSDYVTASPEPIKLAAFSSGDGYNKNPGLDAGEWAITFGWMKESKFMQQYPQTKYIRGISACTNESGTKNIADASKNFALNEQTGEHCWCKMVGPEESAWVYNTDKSNGAGGNCARSCALECISALRTEPMRGAMFTAVKLNGSNANTNDEKVIGDALTDEFKPCEFDWANDTDEYTPYELISRKYNPQRNAIDLKNEIFLMTPSYEMNYFEWETSGFIWMNSEKFQCKYPGVTKIKGVATLNRIEGKEYYTTNKQFKAKEMTGYHCWCKMTYPEQTKWIYYKSYEACAKAPTCNDSDVYNMCMDGCFFGTLGKMFEFIGKK